MTNPMLAELDEVVRLIAKEEKEDAGKPLSILRDNEELDNACYWFMKNNHATEGWQDVGTNHEDRHGRTRSA